MNITDVICQMIGYDIFKVYTLPWELFIVSSAAVLKLEFAGPPSGFRGL